jgi:YegS/Rv2252/BmrU family lipid kinase
MISAFRRSAHRRAHSVLPEAVQPVRTWMTGFMARRAKTALRRRARRSIRSALALRAFCRLAALPPLKTRFIVNPRSGGASRVLARVHEFASLLHADVSLTTHRRHATELAMQALLEGSRLIVAVGGDGTLNEVASSLVDTPATFGLIPCGSGNGLGRHLGIHGNLEHALETLRSGRNRLIDTGLADDHPFFTAAGLGFEAEASARFNQLTDRGLLGYIGTGAKLWRHHVPEDYWIECEGRRLRARGFTVAVANSDQYGNNARIAPGARIDDGLLDLTVVPPVTVWRALPLLAQLFTGAIGAAQGVVRLQSAQFTIERAAPGLIHTDGETHPAGTRVEFTLRPRSLRVMAPPTDDMELLPAEPEFSTLNP